MVAIDRESGRTASPHGGGANVAKALSIIGLLCVCIAAVLSLFAGIKTDPVFYLWIFGLFLQFVAGILAIVLRLSR